MTEGQHKRSRNAVFFVSSDSEYKGCAEATIKEVILHV